MPIYEYECDDCGHRSEAIQKLSEPPLTDCLECGGAIRRLISAPAVQFKGSGWYVTDYAGRKGGETSSGAGEGKADGKQEKAGAGGGSSTAKASPKPSE